MKIISDFVDFYDNLADGSGAVYKRFRSECSQRGSALSSLKALGIETLKIKPVSTLNMYDKDVVVYLDTKGHSGEGKVIMSSADALRQYSNCACSEFVDNVKYTIKFIQIGKRRFNITFIKDPKTLDCGCIYKIEECAPGYSSFRLPIFSIDYIPVDSSMIATDFNEVEVLEKYGLQNKISEEEVIREIEESMKVYKI